MDGEVDSQDVFELLLYIARTAVGEKDVVFHEDPTVNRWLILMMDINNDNKLDSQDLYYLLLYIAMHGAGIKATWSDVLKTDRSIALYKKIRLKCFLQADFCCFKETLNKACA